jgi:Tol biopolymer transport system component
MAPPPAQADLVFSSNLYDPTSEGGDDLFAFDIATSTVTRLTFCNQGGAVCEMVEACPSTDRNRLAVRRVTSDADGDGSLTERDGAALFFLDLSRAVESPLSAAGESVTGVDWSPQASQVAFSARAGAALDDLFRRDVAPDTTNVNLTSSPQLGERRPRFDATGLAVVYEQVDETGKGTVWRLGGGSAGVQLTKGGPGERRLATGEIVGTDTDPCYSPDGLQIAFRRLVSATAGPRGEWNIMVAVLPYGTASGERVIDGGPAFRGAPDWGTRGILFVRTDEATGTTALMLASDSGETKALLTLEAPARIGYPRWLRSPIQP